MATTSRASCKRLEDVEIFQVLEESTDSDFFFFVNCIKLFLFTKSDT